MATVINNPPSNNQAPTYQTVPTNDSTGIGGVLLTIVVIAILFFLLIVYGLPVLRGSNRSAAPAPAPTQQEKGSDINVDIPDKIDVNVKK